MDEYISKHEAYKMLKDKQAAYMQVAVNEAFGTAAMMIDQMKPSDVQPVKKYIENSDGSRGLNSTQPDELTIRKTTVNLSAVAHCDKFICRECGICLQDWVRLEAEEYEDGYIDYTHHEYEFKFCPECGAKIKDGDKNA